MHNFKTSPHEFSFSDLSELLKSGLNGSFKFGKNYKIAYDRIFHFVDVIAKLFTWFYSFADEVTEQQSRYQSNQPSSFTSTQMEKL